MLRSEEYSANQESSESERKNLMIRIIELFRITEKAANWREFFEVKTFGAIG